ncbi:unnamed protein product [Onchocerca flexuosa]|uniref:DH domain-containing protein n=1 Tax=Onchocerca flexuosa TaxID=387005 RepID=A0A183HVS9_9BILA|nr:unnamed protein product [Onchocerca flexuosa]
MRRQSLLDALANPMQRLTRYRLLLKTILKNTVGVTKRDTIQKMILQTEIAARDVEKTLAKNDLQNKLIEILKTIENYEVIDCKEFEKVCNNLTSFFFLFTESITYEITSFQSSIFRLQHLHFYTIINYH